MKHQILSPQTNYLRLRVLFFLFPPVTLGGTLDREGGCLDLDLDLNLDADVICNSTALL